MLNPEVCEAILRDHYRNPRHRGVCESGDEGHTENPVCGDLVKISVATEQGRISCARFEGAGCAVSQAGVSLVLSMVQGLAVEEATRKAERFLALMESGAADPEAYHDEFSDAAVLFSLGRFPARMVCGTLGARLLMDLLRKQQG